MKLYVYKAELVSVYDGDTITVLLDRGWNDKSERKVRLLYFDADETRKCRRKPKNDIKLAMIQKQWLEETLEKAEHLYVWSRELDDFGRILGVVYNEFGESINDMFIEKWPDSEVEE